LTVTSTITSNLIFTDNTYDIGASGATRPRNLFLSGNATVGGDIVLTGGIDVTGDFGVDGNFDVNTNKFTVASATGNTVIAGTLGVTGATTATGGLNVDTISEITSAGGVTIDSVLLKDGDITGTIGANTASAGTFTTFTSTGIDDNATSTKFTVADTGASVTGDIFITDTSPSINFIDNSLANLEHKINSSSDNLTIRSDVNDVDSGNRVEIFVSAQTSVRFNKGLTVFNEAGADVDFRVESDSNTHALFVDAGLNRVGLFTSTPAAPLHIGGVSGTSIRMETTASDNDGNNFIDFYNTDGRMGYLGYASGSADIFYVWNEQNSNVLFGSNGAEKFRITPSSVVVNELSADVDFRVESNNNENMLRVDGGQDRVLMGTSTVAGKILTVRGGASTEGMSQFYQDVATNYPTLTIKQRGQGGNTNDPQGLSIDVAGHNDGLGKMIHTNTINSNFNGGVAVEPYTLWNDGAFQYRLGGVVNENGQSGNRADFRVESNSYTHMLFVDAGLNRVGINENDPEFTLHVNAGTLNNSARFESSDATTIIQTKDGSGTVGFGNTGTTFVVQPNLSYSVIEASQSDVVINNAGQDTNFRVESETKPHMIYVDAGTDKMALGGSSYTADSTINAKDATFGISGDGANPDTAAYGILGTTRTSPASGVIKTHISVTTSGQAVTGLGMDDKPALVLGRASSDQTINVAQQTLSISADEVIVNDYSNDRDFRVESNANTHALFVDGGNSRVGVNNSTPNYTFDVSGSVRQYAGTTILGSSNSDPGVLSLNDNSSTAYTLNFKGTGTRGYGMEGSASSGNYNLTMSNLGTGLFALNVSGYGSFTQTDDTGATVTIGGHQDGRLINFQSGGSTRFYLYGGGTGDDQLSFYESNGDALLHMYDSAGVAINEDGVSSQDFRVESNTNAHFLFMDGSQESFSVATTNTNATYNQANTYAKPNLFMDRDRSQINFYGPASGSTNAKTITITVEQHNLAGSVLTLKFSGHYYNNGGSTFFRETTFHLMRESTATTRIKTRTDVYLGGTQTGVVSVPTCTYTGGQWVIECDIDAGYVTYAWAEMKGIGTNKFGTASWADQ
jgi:hypothetical protein